MSRARGRALGGAVALAAATGFWAGPGAGPAAAYVCSLTIDTPQQRNPPVVLGTNSARFTGAFTAAPGPAGRVLEVSYLAAPGARPATVTRSDPNLGGPDRYDVTTGGLNLNGTYRAQVRATQTETPVFNCVGRLTREGRSTSMTAEVTFGVSVRARPPVDVRSRFEAEPRSAVVTWGRSPDPDTAGYSLSRKVDGGRFEPMGAVPGDALSWTDTGLPAGAATVTYAVTSSRNGPTAGTTSEASDPVAAAPLDVPAPPAPPPDPTPTVPGTPVTNGPGSTVAGAPNTVAPNRTGGAPPTTRPFVLGRPVGGSSSPLGLQFPGGLDQGGTVGGEYAPTLPYQLDPAAPQDEMQLVEDAGDQAFVGGRDRGEEDDKPALAYVAAGLLSAVVAAHVLWLRGQVLRPAPEAVEHPLPVEAAAAARPADSPTWAPPAPLPRNSPKSDSPILVIQGSRDGPAERGGPR